MCEGGGDKTEATTKVSDTLRKNQGIALDKYVVVHFEICNI